MSNFSTSDLPVGMQGALEGLVLSTGKEELELIGYAIELYAFIKNRQNNGTEFFTRDPGEPGVRPITFH